MEEKLRCLRCGYDYTVRREPKEAPRERSCPQCKSNSVRKISSEKEVGHENTDSLKKGPGDH